MNGRGWVALLLVVIAALVLGWRYGRDRARLRGLLEESSAKLAETLQGSRSGGEGRWEIQGWLGGRPFTARLSSGFQLRDDTDDGPAFLPVSEICASCDAPGLEMELRYRGRDARNWTRDAERRLAS